MNIHGSSFILFISKHEPIKRIQTQSEHVWIFYTLIYLDLFLDIYQIFITRIEPELQIRMV